MSDVVIGLLVTIAILLGLLTLATLLTALVFLCRFLQDTWAPGPGRYRH